jgi:hypothetical protein
MANDIAKQVFSSLRSYALMISSQVPQPYFVLNIPKRY